MIQFTALTAADFVAMAWPAGKLLIVDGTNGSDSKAVRGTPRAFKTIAAGLVAALTGDTVLVYPGTYEERVALKDGVNLHYLRGAIHQYTGSGDGRLLADSNGPVTCAITGHGNFANLGVGLNNGVLQLADAGSVVRAEMDYAQARSSLLLTNGTLNASIREMASVDANAHGLAMTGGTVRLECPAIIVAGKAIFVDAGDLIFLGDSARSTGSHGMQLAMDSGSVIVRAREIIGQAGNGVHISATGGAATIEGARLISQQATSNGIAVQISDEFDQLTLKDTVLISNLAGTPATTSINSDGPRNVRIYGSCFANLAKGGQVTLLTGAITVSANVT